MSDFRDFAEYSPLRIGNLLDAVLASEERELLSHLSSGASEPTIAWHMNRRLSELQKIKQSLARKLGTHRLAEAGALLEAAQFQTSRTPAQDLAENVLPVLVGARITGPVTEGTDLCGLRVILASGTPVIVWISRDEDGEAAGWLHIDDAEDPGRYWFEGLEKLQNSVQQALKNCGLEYSTSYNSVACLSLEDIARKAMTLLLELGGELDSLKSYLDQLEDSTSEPSVDAA